MRRFAHLFCVIACSSAPMAAAQESTTRAEATLIAPLTIVASEGLTFGTLAVSSAGDCLYEIAPTGEATKSGDGACAFLSGQPLTARAGGIVGVDLPVVEAGSIEVMLTDATGAPATGAIVASHRRAGGPAEHRVRAAFDGAALAELVAPGCWLLKVAEKDVGRVTVTPGALATIAVRLEPAR